ncbi:MAG: FAD-binding protein, partial [Acidobacteriota bacterium]
MTQNFELQENIPLAPLTTLGIGGNARYFVRVETEVQVADGVEFSHANKLPLFILGGGSNILVSDNGFDGLVLQIALKGIKSSEFRVQSSEPCTDVVPRPGTLTSELITAAAGEDWDDFVAHCVEHGLSGVECLSGIPGFVGGTPVQNVGAYGQQVAETIVSVRCFDRANRRFVTLSNADCGFSYRTSVFNSSERERYIVLSVTYA